MYTLERRLKVRVGGPHQPCPCPCPALLYLCRESVSCIFFILLSACYSWGFAPFSPPCCLSWPNSNILVSSLPPSIADPLTLFRGSRHWSAGSCRARSLQGRPTTCRSVVVLAGFVGQACQTAEHRIEDRPGHSSGAAFQTLRCAKIHSTYLDR
ncbi:hypothetical protein LZ31DRAFT_270711 [Colletotrichum somersetense]|nr:hypothetical protein LZ31DRAFT_270711 [Colletotrichum somersetense]